MEGSNFHEIRPRTYNAQYLLQFALVAEMNEYFSLTMEMILSVIGKAIA
jgi:hypothetical protein